MRRTRVQRGEPAAARETKVGDAQTEGGQPIPRAARARLQKIRQKQLGGPRWEGKRRKGGPNTDKARAQEQRQPRGEALIAPSRRAPD